MSNINNRQWRGIRPASDDVGPENFAGGDVIEQIASGTLLVGDVVYLSADNTVAKAAVAANYVKFIGVVVGGESTNMQVAQDREIASAAQITAALNGKRVIVQINGIARVISDAAVATGAVTGSAIVAGRISNTGATAGQIIGTALTTAGALALNMKLLIAPR